MKWTKEEVNRSIELLKEGNSFLAIANELNRTIKAVRVKLNNLGFKISDYSFQDNKIQIKCLNCEREFEGLLSEERKFCSQSCSAIFNNKQRGNKKKCIICEKDVRDKRQKFCSHKCNKVFIRNKVFADIKNGIKVSEFLFKQYLIYTFGEKCMKCGWNEVNPVTNKVPIQLDHIDGNSENNCLENLRILCPNCHSLTPTFGILNRGNGREWRRLKRRVKKIQ